jgi:glutamate carboxypeptidase
MDTTELIRPEDIDTAPLIAGLTRWVEFETPSERPDLVDLLLDHVEASFDGLPVRRKRHPAKDAHGGMLEMHYAPEGSSGKPMVIMGHVDTVWAAGTLDTRPVHREGDRLFGPGIFDMKSGSYLATETLRRLAVAQTAVPRPVTVLLTGDEETGSHASRALIEELASGAAIVLIPEPSFGDHIAVITSRKGWGRFMLRATGLSAHAGGNLADGRSAIREMARHILDIEALTDFTSGTTFNVGTISGGTRTNVVPADAVIEVDMRVATTAAGETEVAAMLARQPYDQDVTLDVEGGMNRPPYERTAEVEQLYNASCALAKALGMELGETTRGGVSDGNLAAAMKVPVLDGLGCGGRGAHAIDEQIDLTTLAPRAALIHGMLVSQDFQRQALEG